MKPRSAERSDASRAVHRSAMLPVSDEEDEDAVVAPSARRAAAPKPAAAAAAAMTRATPREDDVFETEGEWLAKQQRLTGSGRMDDEDDEEGGMSIAAARAAMLAAQAAAKPAKPEDVLAAYMRQPPVATVTKVADANPLDFFGNEVIKVGGTGRPSPPPPPPAAHVPEKRASGSKGAHDHAKPKKSEARASKTNAHNDSVVVSLDNEVVSLPAEAMADVDEDELMLAALEASKATYEAEFEEHEHLIQGAPARALSVAPAVSSAAATGTPAKQPAAAARPAAATVKPPTPARPPAPA
ncbi:hypothetical protein EON68_00865, partial [archaeon]